jgi:NADPH:quinone reductase-like Zn-dependent oxidoreductase
VSKPDGLSYDDAAAIPTSALAALHGMRDAARLQAGQHVLINGASGGVGTFAVQIAKSLGAEVTGVCSARNVELVRSLGADHVIDYTNDDFTLGDRRYDVIFDNVENHTLSECRRVLRPNGTLVLNSGTGARGLRMIARLTKPLLISPFVSHRLTRFLSNPNQADLLQLNSMVEDGVIRPVVGRTFPLADTVSAFDLIESGHATGNVVVAVSVA